MTLIQRIDQDLKTAMKQRAELVLSTLRLVRTAFKNRQIDVQHELSDEEAVAVLKTLLKQYQDALGDFQQAQRHDLVEKQQAEIDLIARYVTAGMPPAELERTVRQALEGTGVTEFGKAMGLAMKAVAGRADGSQVRAVVQSMLSNQA